MIATDFTDSHRLITLLLFAILEFYLVLYPHTPFNSPVSYKSQIIDSGITDERGFYFDEFSLYRYVFRDKTIPFPTKHWTNEGITFKNSPEELFVHGNIGVFGYYTGTEKIIIDALALSDPFLARLPVFTWRIGHFERNLPKGYPESIINQNERIEDPQLYEFYEKLAIITQSDKLFTKERLRTIFLFNIGAYNYLIPNHIE